MRRDEVRETWVEGGQSTEGFRECDENFGHWRVLRTEGHDF